MIKIMIIVTLITLTLTSIMTSFNVVITLAAGFVIASTVGVVVGLLVFDGWSLGIIQSVIFSCAIGMAVDFVAHISHMFGR